MENNYGLAKNRIFHSCLRCWKRQGAVNMRIDRLIGILCILLQKEKTTAPELAEYFEVSRRTINRDIEELCKAGIPILATQGYGGGISIMDGYYINQALFTNKEMQDILAGLKSLDSINHTNRYVQLMEKLSTSSSCFMSGNPAMLINLSSWYKNSLPPKIEIIRNAIELKTEINFHYYSPKGESLRQIEPYCLIFQWAGWYVWGWCKIREDFRLFKLNRMAELTSTGHVFEGRKCPLPDFENQNVFTGNIKVKALFKPNYKWRLVDEFGTGCYKEQEDGRLLFQSDYTSKNYLLGWLLSFGDGVELIEPEDIREELRIIIKKLSGIYM